MLEVSGDSGGRLLDAPEVAEGLAVKGRLIRCRDVGVDGALQVAVEVLVGIELGRVGWQEEDLDLRGIRREPAAHLGRLVNTEVVEDQEDLALGIARQPTHEDDERRRFQGALVDHEPHLAAVGDRRQDGQTRAARWNSDDGRLSLRRVAAMARLIAAQAGFIAPADLGPVALRAPRDLWILDLQPALHGRVVPLVSALRRSL